MSKSPNVPSIKILPSKTLWPQWIGGIGATLLTIVAGLMGGGWSSPYMAKLLSKDSPLPITESQASWVAALINVGRLIGGMVVPLGVEYLGPGRTTVAIGFPTAIGLICPMFANHIAWLYASRVLCGIGLGMTFGAFPIYLGEIADPSIRGSMVSLAINGAAIGTLLGNLMGSYLPMEYFSIVTLVPTVIYAIIYTVIPESPHYLLRVGKIEEAEKSLQWYNRNVEVKKELESLKKYVFASTSTSIKDRLKEFNAPQNRKAGFTIIVLFMFMHLSGVNSLVYYMETIMIRAKVSSIDPAWVVVIAGIVAVVSGCLSMYLIERTGRRFLMIISSVGIFISMIGMGLHFALLDHRSDLPNRDWLAIGSIVFWQVFYCLGIYVIPSTILSELFPANLKNLASTGAGMSSAIFAFIGSKSYQPIVNDFGDQYAMWLNGLVAIIAVPFAVFVMPETKGKSLQDIQILMGDEKIAKDKEFHTGRV